MRFTLLPLLTILPMVAWSSQPTNNRCTMFRPSTPSRDNAWISQCQGVCGLKMGDQVTDITSIACISFTKESEWQPYPDGGEILIGHCTCNSPFLASVATTFVEAVTAVAEFDEFLFKTIFEQVALLGVAFIPGVGQAIEGPLIAIIASAKVAQYTLGAARGLGAFSEWLRPISASADDIAKVWNTVRGVSDDVLPRGLNIPRGLPRAKRDDEDVPDNEPPPREQPRPSRPEPTKPEPTQPEPTKPEPTQPEPTQPEPTKPEPTQPEPTQPEPTQPEPTKPEPTQPEPTEPEPTHLEPTRPEPTKDEPTAPRSNQSEASHAKPSHHGHPSPYPTRPHTRQSSSAPSHCRVPRSDGAKQDCDHHSTTVVRWVEAAKPTTATKFCDAEKHPQACYHYYSAAKQHDNIGTRFTCQSSNSRNEAVTATDAWKRQHNQEWSSFTRDDYNRHGKGKGGPRCQKDEWPPAYFVPIGREEENPQMIRYIPDRENIGAGQLWREFCKTNDANDGNGRYKKDDITINEDMIKQKLIKLEGEPNTRQEIKDGTTTTHSTYGVATWTRGVFELEFKWQKDGVGGEKIPTKENNWFLDENPCWPKDITPDDPGYALLTDDNYYNHAPEKAKAMRELYKDIPEKYRVDRANEIREKEGALVVEVARSPPRKKGKHNNDGGDGSSGPSRKRALGRRQLQVLDNGFAIRDTNSTRRLSTEEIRRDTHAIRCTSSTCSQERAALPADQAYAIVPPPARTLRLPLPAVEAMATAVGTRFRTLETRTLTRMTISPNLPEPTLSSGLLL